MHMLDLVKIREDTIGCKDKLFFNSAGSSLPPHIVTKKMIEYLEVEEQLGGYLLAEIRSKELEETYEELAKLINAAPRQIAITFNATDSFARALTSIPFRSKDVIFTTSEDYVSNHLQFLSLRKRLGIEIIKVPGNRNGNLDIDQFEVFFKKYHPRLVTVTHVPTSSGLIQDVEAVGAICEVSEDCYFLVDACQSVGQMEIDVKKIKCDFLSVTGRKFLRGPRGTGFLYVSDKVLNNGLEPLMLDLRGADWMSENEYRPKDSAQRFEWWEFQYSGVIGLKEAVRYANKVGMHHIEKYGHDLTNRIREGLKPLKGVRLLDLGSKLGSIITLRKENVDRTLLEKHLTKHKVFYSIVSKQNALLDFQRKQIDWSLRLSPHYFNSEKEAQQLIEIIDSV